MAIVEMLDGTVDHVMLDKFLASRMRILEELSDFARLEEKEDYWRRLLNPVELVDELTCHWTNGKDHVYVRAENALPLRGLRRKNEYWLAGCD